MRSEYTFNYGWLAGRRVCDISDKDLARAIRFNRDYIRDHRDPRSSVKYQGRWTTVGKLTASVVENRIRLAQEALEACNEEQRYRRDMERAANDMDESPADSAAPAPEEQDINFAGVFFRAVLTPECEELMLRLGQAMHEQGMALVTQQRAKAYRDAVERGHEVAGQLEGAATEMTNAASRLSNMASALRRVLEGRQP